MEERNFTVKFTTIAKNDLDVIYNYVLNESSAKEIADHLIGSIEESIMRLRLFPYSANFVEDSALRSK